MEDISVEFHLNPELLVLFRKYVGVRTKESVLVMICKEKDESLIALTGFDADSCAFFEMTIDSGIGFAGRLFANDGTIIGDIRISKTLYGHFLTVRLDGMVSVIKLKNEDISELTTIFNLIGGSHVAQTH